MWHIRTKLVFWLNKKNYCVNVWTTTLYRHPLSLFDANGILEIVISLQRRDGEISYWKTYEVVANNKKQEERAIFVCPKLLKTFTHDNKLLILEWAVSVGAFYFYPRSFCLQDEFKWNEKHVEVETGDENLRFLTTSTTFLLSMYIIS